MSRIETQALGQVGYRFSFGSTVVYIDPYLSDYVAEMEGARGVRMFTAPFSADSITDANWVLITHAHIDHCDPLTVVPLAAASPAARFLCSSHVAEKLHEFGIAEHRIETASEVAWSPLGPGIEALAVPAAHPEIARDEAGQAQCIGFVFEYGGRRLYHAGDTSLHEELLSKLKTLAPIEIAFLPVNERNFFRERQGIVGNMTLREAFLLAEEIEAETMVPMHWDMFSVNSVPRAEIELFYSLMKPKFELRIYPDEV